jgi:hypothetical protein
MRYLAMTVAVLVFCAGCGTNSVAVKDGELGRSIDLPGSSGDWVEAMGIGAADQALQNNTQRKATSRNAAVVDAQYQLAAKLKGVMIEGGITIEKAMETDSRIQATVNSMLKGAEVTKMEWTSDDGCVATVRINKRFLEKETGLKLL